MVRREMLGVVGAAGMAIVGTQAWAEDDKPEHLHHHFDKIHEDCLKACHDCETACNQAALHCLKILETGKGELAAHAKAHAYTADCASFCSLSTMMIGRGSAMMTLSCSACAEACHACALACDQVPSPQMRECATACRECEKTCTEMVRSMKGSTTRG